MPNPSKAQILEVLGQSVTNDGYPRLFTHEKLCWLFNLKSQIERARLEVELEGMAGRGEIIYEEFDGWPTQQYYRPNMPKMKLAVHPKRLNGGTVND